MGIRVPIRRGQAVGPSMSLQMNMGIVPNSNDPPRSVSTCPRRGYAVNQLTRDRDSAYSI